jgi:hypothetical protein
MTMSGDWKRCSLARKGQRARGVRARGICWVSTTGGEEVRNPTFYRIPTAQVTEVHAPLQNGFCTVTAPLSFLWLSSFRPSCKLLPNHAICRV